MKKLTPSEAIRELELGKAIEDCPPIRIEIHNGVVENVEDGKDDWARGIGIQTLFSADLFATSG